MTGVAINSDLPTLDPAANRPFGRTGLDTLDWPAIALRFTTSLAGVHTAIVGTTSVRNVEANLRAAAQGPLPDAAVRLLRDAFAAADPDGSWPGLT